MTRGGLLDPLSSLFSFKTAALFWSRNCKFPNQLLWKRKRNAQGTVGTKKQWQIPFYFSEFELYALLCQHCALLLRLQVCLKNPTEKSNNKKEAKQKRKQMNGVDMKYKPLTEVLWRLREDLEEKRDLWGLLTWTLDPPIVVARTGLFHHCVLLSIPVATKTLFPEQISRRGV